MPVNWTGSRLIAVTACCAPELAESGVASLARETNSSFLCTALSLMESTRCLAWALTSVFSASASTVSPSS